MRGDGRAWPRGGRHLVGRRLGILGQLRLRRSPGGAGRRRSRARRRAGSSSHSSSLIAERSSSDEVGVGHLAHPLRDQLARPRALWRRLNSGSVSGVIVYSTASVATESRIASYSLRARPRRAPPAGRAPAARSTAGRSAVSSICRVRSERGPWSSWSPMLRERDDVVGDDLGVDVGDLAAGGAGRGRGSVKRPDLPRLDRLEDHADRQPVRDVSRRPRRRSAAPTSTGSAVVRKTTGMPSSEAEEEAEVDR